MRTSRNIERPRWHIVGAVVGLLVLTTVSGVVAHRYLSAPTRVAQAFLQRCRTADYDGLYALFDAKYQEVFTPQASRDLLQTLHKYVPRAYRVTMRGYPNMHGYVTDWRAYNVRVQFEEPEEARQAHKSCVITLVQGKDSAWRVAFQPTYHSLFASLYGTAGEQYLLRALWRGAGSQAQRLWDWRHERKRQVKP